MRTGLHLLSLLLGCLLAGCLHAPGSLTVRGELFGDHTWQGEVLIAGDVTLPAGATLTILPGTVIRFLPPGDAPGNRSDHPYFAGSELNVLGTLLAEGKPAAPIVFASLNDTDPPGSWGAVNFAEESKGVLRYCIFRQADSAVHSRQARVEVSKSLFERNLVGIRFHSSVITVTNNLLRDNDTGIRFHYGVPIVKDNRFAGNRVNLFVTAHPYKPLFENNIFGAPGEYHVVLGEEVPEDVPLGGNAWDTLDAESVLERVFDGRRSPHLGRVIIEPLVVIPPETVGPMWIQ